MLINISGFFLTDSSVLCVMATNCDSLEGVASVAMNTPKEQQEGIKSFLQMMKDNPGIWSKEDIKKRTEELWKLQMQLLQGSASASSSTSPSCSTSSSSASSSSSSSKDVHNHAHLVRQNRQPKWHSKKGGYNLILLLREMRVKTGAEAEIEKADGDGRYREYEQARAMLRACRTSKVLFLCTLYSSIGLLFPFQFTRKRPGEEQICDSWKWRIGGLQRDSRVSKF